MGPTRRAKSSIRRLEAEQPVLVVDAEDRAHDHRQGDPLGVGAHRERLADRPALHLLAGHLDDQLAVALDPLAVEGRQQQLALADVGRVVEGEDRVRPQRRLEHGGIGLAGVEGGGRAGEERFDQVGAGDVDDLAEVGEADREDVALAALVGGEEAERVTGVFDRLQEGGRARSWGERVAARGVGAGEGRLLHWRAGYAKTGWSASLPRRRSCARRRAGRGRRGGPSPRGRGPGARCRGRCGSCRRPRRGGRPARRPGR